MVLGEISPGVLLPPPTNLVEESLVKKDIFIKTIIATKRVRDLPRTSDSDDVTKRIHKTEENILHVNNVQYNIINFTLSYLYSGVFFFK